MATFTERLAIIIEANGGKAVAEFKKVGAAAKGVGGPVGEAGGILSKFSGSLGSLGGGAGTAAIVAAGVAIAKFAADGVSAFVEVTGEVRKFQRVSGATAEDASKLVAAFHVLGIDADAAGTAVFRMAVKIGQGNKAFADSGVAIARTKTGAVDLVGTILNVGDAYKKLPDATKRADLLANVFGARAGQTLIPLLGKTREELEKIFAAAERHGLIFNEEQLAKAKEFGVATRELGEAYKGLQVEVGQRLVPALTDLSIAITKVLDATHQGVGKAFLDVITHAPGLIALIGGAAHLIAGGEGDAARALGETTTAITEQAQAAEQLKHTIFSAVDAQRSFEEAGRSVESAQRGLAKATKTYNDLLKEGAVDEKKVADARRSLADATRSLGHAQREQSKAQNEYNDALAAYNILGTDTAHDKLTDASNNLADANDSVASATEAQTKATEDLKTAQAGDPDFQAKLADAKQGVADATQHVADATYNLGRRSYENVAAHDAEAQAIAGKADQVERLKGDLEAMLQLHPEQFAFLAPIIAALGGLGPAAGATSPLADGGLLPGTSLLNPGGTGPAGVSSSPNPWDVAAGTNQVSGGTTTTNNINVNVSSPQNADPVGLARNIVWNLN